jgi:hypothetical protein
MQNSTQSSRLSFGRRLIGFLVAVLIGVGATLAWQSGSARQVVANSALRLGLTWLPPLRIQGGSATNHASLPDVRASTPGTGPSQAEPVVVTASETVTPNPAVVPSQHPETLPNDIASLRRSIEDLTAQQKQTGSNDLTQLRQTIEQIGHRQDQMAEHDLAAVRQSVDQLLAKRDQIVAKQDQMSGDIAKLLSAEQDIQTRMSGGSRSATPQSRSATPQSRHHAIATPIGPQNLR